MHNKITTASAAQVDDELSTKSATLHKVEATRRQIRAAQCGIQASEGRFLDYQSAEDIGRTLEAAARNLAELTITLAVMERKVSHNG